MLRLDLKDDAGTVLFIEPMNGIKVRKEKPKVKEGTCGLCYELCIETGSDVCYTTYDSMEYRDAVYEYVLNKISEYLFPQIEATGFKPICPNDAAMPEYLRKPKE